MSLSLFSIKNFVKEYTALINGEVKTFTSRPYNRFMPNNTKWWVVPSTAWPAFGKEKLVFWTENSYLYAGINIEKGILIEENDENKLEKIKHIVMDESWGWGRFVSDMRSGGMDELVDSFKSRVNYPVHMILSASLVNNVGMYDPFSDKSDSIEFAITEDTLQVCESKFDIMAINQLETVEGIQEIPDIIESTNGINWIWMDVMIYAPVYCIKRNKAYNLSRIRSRLKPLEERIKKIYQINTRKE